MSFRVGRRGFIAGAAGAVAGAALYEGSASAADPAYSAFNVVNPTRLVDTRPAEGSFGYTRLDSRTIRIKVAGRKINGSEETVPQGASAAVFTLVGINSVVGGNYLSAFPTGVAWPGTANLNMVGFGSVSPNLVTVRLGTDGSVDVLSKEPCDVVLDLIGVYIPTGGEPVRAGRYRRLPIPERVLDTRDGARIPGAGEVVRVDLTPLVSQGLLSSDAIAVAANITATNTTRGFIAAYPFGTEYPGTSTLNVEQDDVRGIGTMVKLGTENGRIGFNIYVQWGAHLIVDLAGYMTGESAARSTTGQFVPVTPKRLLDTRQGLGGLKRLWPGWTREFTLPDSYAQQAGALAVNLAVTGTMGPGYFTLLGARKQRALVSNLNVTGPGQTLSNHAITEVSTNGVEVFSSGGGDVICDVVGWFKAYSGPSQPSYSAPAVNPDPPPIPPPYWMEIPRIGVGRSVIDGDSTSVVDRGLVWHWTGTGVVGQQSGIAAFAHRTSAGGTFRNIHYLQPGDQIALITADHRKYTYEYFDRVLTTPNATQILGATQFIPGQETLSIVACTVGFDSSKQAYPDAWAPTSLKYRIVVRLRLVRWDDIIATT